MVSKVFSGHSFYHACRYVVNKPGAEVLEYEGVRGHDFKVMSDDFIMQQQLRPQKEKACFHCCLSFYPGEKVDDKRMVQIAKEYLERLKIIDTQFAITKHTDRRHIHIHIVANMVNNIGQVIPDSYLGLRGKKAAQQLTEQYHLIAAIGKSLELTNMEALHKSEANKYTVYKAIVEALPQCKTMKQLQEQLLLQGIQTEYKYKGQTTEKQGVSFKIGEDCFKGSKIDRQFSLGNLEKKLEQNRKQALNYSHSFPATPSNQKKQNQEPTGNFGDNLRSQDKESVLGSLIEKLTSPEENFGETPHELLKESKRKNKKRSQNPRGGLHH